MVIGSLEQLIVMIVQINSRSYKNKYLFGREKVLYLIEFNQHAKNINFFYEIACYFYHFQHTLIDQLQRTI